jgi:hypothetical protein
MHPEKIKEHLNPTIISGILSILKKGTIIFQDLYEIEFWKKPIRDRENSFVIYTDIKDYLKSRVISHIKMGAFCLKHKKEQKELCESHLGFVDKQKLFEEKLKEEIEGDPYYTIEEYIFNEKQKERIEDEYWEIQADHPHERWFLNILETVKANPGIKGLYETMIKNYIKEGIIEDAKKTELVFASQNPIDIAIKRYDLSTTEDLQDFLSNYIDYSYFYNLLREEFEKEIMGTVANVIEIDDDSIVIIRSY